MRHPRLLHVKKGLHEGFPSSQGLRVTALNDVVFMKRGDKTALLLICPANALISLENAVLYPLP